MCGIVGIFNLNKNLVDEKLMKSMLDKISHRGPDSEGFFIKNNIALAHKRLSILDTSINGSQPMSSKTNKWTIVFNGCIYNFAELKEELKSKGHVFKSKTDTEVICEGLDEYGTSFFERLNGMFAIAAWNKREKQLYLSRDRFGIKPLYYWFNGNTLCFASEIKAIIEHPDYKIDVDLNALNEYFTFQNIFSFKTLFKGVTMLPPANTVKINSKSTFVEHNSWWDYDFTKTDDSMSFKFAQSETKRLFEQAVTRQMISRI